MKKLFIIANWKSNINTQQAKDWLAKISNLENKEIIVCPSFTLLSILRSYILNHNSFLKLGAQDISAFDEGLYTGEVNGNQIKEFADYVIIGHSERRQYFSEDNTIIQKKIVQAGKYNLTPILCVSDPMQIENLKLKIENSSLLVAYEPVFAIGTGNPDTPENAGKIAKIIKEKNNVKYVLYGGSVTSQNVHAFTSIESVDGVLVGKASLDAKEFGEIIKNA